MIVFFDPVTSDRLANIERAEGIPPEELVRQAVGVWVELTQDERHAVGIHAMQLVMRRHRA